MSGMADMIDQDDLMVEITATDIDVMLTQSLKADLSSGRGLMASRWCPPREHCAHRSVSGPDQWRGDSELDRQPRARSQAAGCHPCCQDTAARREDLYRHLQAGAQRTF